MRECDWLDWIAIPADRVVTIAHAMLSRIFKHEDKLNRAAHLPGKENRIQMNTGYVGTT